MKIWPQKTILTTGKSFSHEEKWEKLDFFKPPSIPNFELLDSLFTHYHMPILKKRIHRDKLILSHSMFLPLVQSLTKLRNNCHFNRPGHGLFMMARNSSVEEKIFVSGQSSSSSNDVTKLRQQQKWATTKNASEAQNRFSDIKDQKRTSAILSLWYDNHRWY